MDLLPGGATCIVSMRRELNSSSMKTDEMERRALLDLIVVEDK